MEQIAAAYSDSDSNAELHPVDLDCGGSVVTAPAWLDVVQQCSDAAKLPTSHTYAQHMHGSMRVHTYAHHMHGSMRVSGALNTRRRGIWALCEPLAL